MRDQRPFDQGVAGADAVAAVDPEVLAVRHEVLALDAGLRCLTMMVRLPRRFSSSSSTRPSISAMTAGSFGRRASNNSVTRGQAAGDVLGAADLAGGLGQERPGGDLLPFGDLDAGPSGM